MKFVMIVLILGLFPAPAAAQNFGWVFGEWSECEPCDEGVSVRSVICEDLETQETVDDSFCLGLEVRPASEFPCNMETCQYFWGESEWSVCEDCLASRTVYCMQSETWVTVSEDKCDPELRPAETEDCCVVTYFTWTIGPWSECDAMCDGHQTRDVGCVEMDTNGRVIQAVDIDCCYWTNDEDGTPVSEQSCDQSDSCSDESSVFGCGCVMAERRPVSPAFLMMLGLCWLFGRRFWR
ncbi:MAG: hypothetical protein CVU59_10195 [Deltaproteobacteria bacterium HGW-Deltaproteobacteria-17]|nr:MAG: hypothetical protein CVU59_10195 [Deltaproteobacteria bacterium HGW-Deltaproteobacteria-17]